MSDFLIWKRVYGLYILVIDLSWRSASVVDHMAFSHINCQKKNRNKFILSPYCWQRVLFMPGKQFDTVVLKWWKKEGWRFCRTVARTRSRKVEKGTRRTSPCGFDATQIGSAWSGLVMCLPCGWGLQNSRIIQICEMGINGNDEKWRWK